MKLTILGSGTSVPSAKRAPSGYLLEIEDRKLIFDSGPGTFVRLAQKQISVCDITHLFYTHLHPDHTLDFMFFLFASRNPDLKRTKPLVITGPRGFKEFYEKTRNLYGSWMDVPFEFEFREVLEDTLAFEHFNIQSAEVLHHKHSVAYAVTDRLERKFVYSGDMEENENIRHLIKNADVFLCECSFPDAHYCPGHMTPSSVARVTKNAGVKKIILTHFYPVWDDVNLEDELKPLKKETVTFAEDGMQVEF